MSIQEREDKYVRRALESLQNMTPAHLPNLESKWALLETSLTEQRQNRKKIVWIFRAAAVLAILLFSSIMLLIQTIGTQIDEKKQPFADLSENAKENAVPEIPSQKIKIKHRTIAGGKAAVRALPPEPSIETISLVAANDTTVLVEKDTTQVFAKTQTAKRTARVRYIDMDFGEISASKAAVQTPAYAAGWQISIKPSAHYSKTTKQEPEQLKTLGFKF